MFRQPSRLRPYIRCRWRQRDLCSVANGCVWSQRHLSKEENSGRARLNAVHAGGPEICGSRGSDMTVTTEALATTDLEFARQLGQQLRVDSIRCSTAAGSGHPTSSMSAADLIAVLITRYLQYDWAK